MNGRRQQQGYTLLEVVVAFAILVLSLGALFESFSMTLRRSEKARNLSRAVLLAESTRDRVGVDVPLAPPGTNGVDGDCRWSVQSAPVPQTMTDHAPTVSAFRIGIDVLCGERGAIGTAHLDTAELAPAQ